MAPQHNDSNRIRLTHALPRKSPRQDPQRTVGPHHHPTLARAPPTVQDPARWAMLPGISGVPPGEDPCFRSLDTRGPDARHVPVSSPTSAPASPRNLPWFPLPGRGCAQVHTSRCWAGSRKRRAPNRWDEVVVAWRLTKFADA
jgi:hypothetical protein